MKLVSHGLVWVAVCTLYSVGHSGYTLQCEVGKSWVSVGRSVYTIQCGSQWVHSTV